MHDGNVQDLLLHFIEKLWNNEQQQNYTNILVISTNNLFEENKQKYLIWLTLSNTVGLFKNETSQQKKVSKYKLK